MPTNAQEPPAAQRTTGVLAHVLGAQLVGPPDLAISDFGTLESARPGALTFIRDGRYAGMWAKSRATAAVVTRGIDVPDHDPAQRALLIVDDADLAMIKLLELASPPPPPPSPALASTKSPGIHPSAVVDLSAHVDPTASLGPCVVVGPGARIGARCVLHAHVFIGTGAQIGEDTLLHSGVKILDRCRVGNRCIFWPGVVIGSDGFGYRPPPSPSPEAHTAKVDPSKMGPVKVPHIGNVEIGSFVEIGANTCIDRGKLGPTSIGDHTKIDNMVQIGHNCTIGRGCLICGCAAIAGSVTIGDGVTLAGQAAVTDNMVIGTGATITAKAGVMNPVPPGETWSGFPARPHREQMRAWAAIRRMAQHLRDSDARKREAE